MAAIDFRPANGRLYGVSRAGRLYRIDPDTGAATQVAALAPDPTDASNPFTGLEGTVFDRDFNPVPDRIRLVSDTGQNLRVNVDTGGTVTDGALNPGIPALTAVAYTNGFMKPPTTTLLYGIDTGTDRLVIQNPPNNGTLVTVGPLGVDATAQTGFDIEVPENTAYAALVKAGETITGLYAVHLTLGSARRVGTVGTADNPYLLRGLAVTGRRVRGDVNGDGSVDVADAVVVLRTIVGLEELSTFRQWLADANEAGGVTVEDAIVILRVAVGLPE